MLHASMVWKLIKDGVLKIEPPIDEESLRGSTLDLKLTNNPEEIRLITGDVELSELSEKELTEIGSPLSVEGDTVIIPPKSAIIARSLEKFSSSKRLFALVIPRFFATKRGLIVQGYIEIESEPKKAEFVVYNTNEKGVKLLLGKYTVAQLVFFDVKEE